jgi:hypothetical protein
MFEHQLVKDRQATLLGEAEQSRLARERPRKEPLVKFHLTIELQLGGRKVSV